MVNAVVAERRQHTSKNVVDSADPVPPRGDFHVRSVTLIPRERRVLKFGIAAIGCCHRSTTLRK
jgi:hypothetical protein